MESKNDIRIIGGIAIITLTKGYEAIIDAADVPLIAGHRWHALTGSGKVYAFSRTGRKLTAMSRLLMDEFIWDEDHEVDHKNGATLDNRRVNLRVVTHQENAWNQRRQITATNTYRGVTLGHAKKNGPSYRVQLRLDGRYKQVGTFKNEVVAAIAYDVHVLLSRPGVPLTRLNLPDISVRVAESVRDRANAMGASIHHTFGDDS